MELSIKLRTPKKDSSSLFAQGFYRQQRFYLGLGNETNISVSNWNSKKETIKNINPSNKEKLMKVKARIKNVLDANDKYFRECENKNINPDLDTLKEILNKVIGKSKDEKKDQFQKLDFHDYVKKFIEDIKTGERTYTNGKGERKRYTPSTIKTYNDWYNSMMEYEKVKHKKISWSNIDIDVYNSIITYFESKGCSVNYIGKIVKHIKSILRASFDEGHHTNPIADKKAFKVLKSDTTEIYLTQTEIEKIKNAKLSDRLELSRDIFLIGCYTALRHSDYSRLKQDHIVKIDGLEYISITTKKTTTKVVIPIRPELNEILSKYNYNVPRHNVNYLNTDIKTICESLGINENIEVTEIIKGRTITKMVPKFKMVASHTARRTGATLMYLAEIPTIDIMNITGHTTEQSFLKYIRVTKEESAKRLSTNSFFTGGLKVAN